MTKYYSGCGYAVEVMDGTPMPGPCPKCFINFWTTVRPNMGMSGHSPICPTCGQFWPEPPSLEG